MSARARAICWLIAAAAFGFVAGISVAGADGWWAILTAIAAMLCALGAGVEAIVKLARRHD